MWMNIMTEERQRIRDEIVYLLRTFDQQYKNLSFKKGIYIYGSSGTGKTHFIKEILKSLDYDILQYDASETRNKCLIENITNNQLSSNNVLNMFYKKKQKMAVLMDDIEAMNNGDKGGISSLIKLIRQKKTKRQRSENQTALPIICIGSYYMDKKIKELMKICNVFELKPLNETETMNILSPLSYTLSQKQQIVQNCNGDLRKLLFHTKMLQKNPDWLNTVALTKTTLNPSAKDITKELLCHSKQFNQHGELINETDRTIVALLWHENVIDYISSKNPENRVVYQQILKNICFADYIDRITFQSQIWQFNEMSSLIKTMYNNKLFHEISNGSKEKQPTGEIRFTKILTKYSTEYNNINFVFHLCHQLNMDRKDVFSFFEKLRSSHGTNTKKDCLNTEAIIELEKRGINKLDIKRIYRYLDHTEKKETSILEQDNETEIEEDELEPSLEEE